MESDTRAATEEIEAEAEIQQLRRELLQAREELARASEETKRLGELEARLERVEKERQLFVALVENSSDFIGIADADGEPVYVNPAGRRMVGLDADHPIEDTRIPDYYPPDQRAFAAEVIVPAMTERGHWAGETWFRHWQTEEAIPVSHTHFMIRERDTDRVLGMGTITRDVTERGRVDDERARLAAIVDSSDDAIIGKTLDGTIESWNSGAMRLFGYTFEEIRGRPIAVLVPPDRLEESHHAITAVRRGSNVGHYETVRRRKDGGLVDVSVSHSPIRDRAGRVVGVATIARDISAKKLAERRLAASLAEKEVLLREIHHRVKNNLQVISSLLNLQGSRVADSRAQELLVESQSRVRSIALVHEKLYGSKDLASIDFGDYLRALTSALWSTYGDVARRLALEVQTDEVRLGIEAAMPCGLLVNELVTNALKHAYPGDRRGAIVVDLRVDVAAGQICLEVADDGRGFPEGLDFREVTSLGMQLVVSLTRQLQGTIELDRNGGTRFRVRFPSGPARPP
jgi:PAS domain S-box-containing protein